MSFKKMADTSFKKSVVSSQRIQKCTLSGILKIERKTE